MTLVRWDPFRELSDLQERMNRLFGGFGHRADDDVLRRGTWWPLVDIYENDKQELVIKAELPDMKKDDIALTVDNNVLTISGEKQSDTEMKDENCHRVERTFGQFSRSFSLPQTIDTAEGQRRVQERRADRQAAEAGGSEAEADHGEGCRLDRSSGIAARARARAGSGGGASVPAGCLVPDTTHHTTEVDTMNVRPLRDRILVKRLEEEEQRVGGIIIPDTAKEKPQQGKVVAVGTGRITDEGKVIPLDVKAGDRILFGKYAGSEIKLDGEEYLIVREDEVLGILE